MKIKLFVLLINLMLSLNCEANCNKQKTIQIENPIIAYYTRLPFEDDGFTGKYADIIVHIKDKGDFVFSREYSYQPYWQPIKATKVIVKRIIDRKGDGPLERPDKNNICSNAAIVERNDKFVKVHWRYAPDITTLSFTDFTSAYNKAGNPSPFYSEYADEYFTIYADGTVKREVKKGTYLLAQWNDPSNLITEKITLTSIGIKEERTPVVMKSKVKEGIRGEKIKKNNLENIVLYFPLDEGLKAYTNQVKESISKTSITIDGVYAYWKKGVSGTSLSFDSYSNAIVVPSAKVPILKEEFSIQAWIAPQEYPINTAAIVDHLGIESGYFVGLNSKGEIECKLGIDSKITTLTSSVIPLYKWTNVMVVYKRSTGVSIYFDGVLVTNKVFKGDFMDASGIPISIGMTRSFLQFPAGAEREVTKGFTTNMVFSGLIDELKVFNRSLTNSEIKNQYLALKPSETQPLKPWVLPESSKNVQGFGAMNTNLKFSPEWDGLWRVGDYSDIVVTFKDKPWRYVFWRGTRYLPSLVTDYGKNGIWSSDQGPEHYNGQCFEHMSDMLCRFSNARIISSNPARTIVHWRNSSINIGYKWPSTDDAGWGIWTDEYWTIYPDGVSVRNQFLHNGTGSEIIEMNQNEILHHPGQSTEDLLYDQAVTLSNSDNEIEKFTRSTGITGKKIRTDKNLQYINLKSKTKQFQIGELGTKIEVEIFQDVWWNGWNHYPVQLIPSDGTDAYQYDRVASTCPATFREVRHQLNKNTVEAMTLYGLTNSQPEELTNLNRSWNFAPDLKVIQGATFLGYKKNEKAYHLHKLGNKIQFEIDASKESPLINPAFVINNWGDDKSVLNLKIEGKVLKEGNEYHKGIEITPDGSFSLVVFFTCSSEKKLVVEITKL